MIIDERSAWECINKLHAMGPSKVVITSTNMIDENGDMIGYFSDNESLVKGTINIPTTNDTRHINDENQSGFVQFTGTGDMFAACLCAHSGTFFIAQLFVKFIFYFSIKAIS